MKQFLISSGSRHRPGSHNARKAPAASAKAGRPPRAIWPAAFVTCRGGLVVVAVPFDDTEGDTLTTDAVELEEVLAVAATFELEVEVLAAGVVVMLTETRVADAVVAGAAVATSETRTSVKLYAAAQDASDSP